MKSPRFSREIKPAAEFTLIIADIAVASCASDPTVATTV